MYRGKDRGEGVPGVELRLLLCSPLIMSTRVTQIKQTAEPTTPGRVVVCRLDLHNRPPVKQQCRLILTPVVPQIPQPEDPGWRRPQHLLPRLRLLPAGPRGGHRERGLPGDGPALPAV